MFYVRSCDIRLGARSAGFSGFLLRGFSHSSRRRHSDHGHPLHGQALPSLRRCSCRSSSAAPRPAAYYVALVSGSVVMTGTGVPRAAYLASIEAAFHPRGPTPPSPYAGRLVCCIPVSCFSRPREAGQPRGTSHARALTRRGRSATLLTMRCSGQRPGVVTAGRSRGRTQVPAAAAERWR